MDADAYLIKRTYSRDEIGQQIPIDKKRIILAEVKSVYREEFSKAKQEGLLAKVRIDVSMFDYKGEKFAEYMGKQYKIYRTFLREEDEMVELYLGEELK